MTTGKGIFLGLSLVAGAILAVGLAGQGLGDTPQAKYEIASSFFEGHTPGKEWVVVSKVNTETGELTNCFVAPGMNCVAK